MWPSIGTYVHTYTHLDFVKPTFLDAGIIGNTKSQNLLFARSQYFYYIYTTYVSGSKNSVYGVITEYFLVDDKTLPTR